jgi:hypothetical protein
MEDPGIVAQQGDVAFVQPGKDGGVEAGCAGGHILRAQFCAAGPAAGADKERVAGTDLQASRTKIHALIGQ